MNAPFAQRNLFEPLKEVQHVFPVTDQVVIKKIKHTVRPEFFNPDHLFPHLFYRFVTVFLTQYVRNATIVTPVGTTPGGLNTDQIITVMVYGRIIRDRGVFQLKFLTTLPGVKGLRFMIGEIVKKAREKLLSFPHDYTDPALHIIIRKRGCMNPAHHHIRSSVCEEPDKLEYPFTLDDLSRNSHKIKVIVLVKMLKVLLVQIFIHKDPGNTLGKRGGHS